jgi:NACalpha-BTF3-like transcription factor
VGDNFMKYFKKEAEAGVPKTNVERVMSHYNVSREEAIRMMTKKTVAELLPTREGKNRR